MTSRLDPASITAYLLDLEKKQNFKLKINVNLLFCRNSSIWWARQLELPGRKKESII